MIQDTAISYYGLQIGNLTQAFKWYHFQRLLVTPNPLLLESKHQITPK